MNYIKEITIDEETRQELRQDLQKWFAHEGNGNNELKQAEKRLVKLRRMEQNLQRLILEDEISLDDFKELRRQIEADRDRVHHIIDTVNQKETMIKADFEVALQLATELDFLFENGNFSEKRLLCETLFKRVYLKEGKVSDVELNAPFGLIATQGKGSGTVQAGSPNGMKDRTFQATFKLPEFKSTTRKKREFQNPVLLARQWRDWLDRKIYGSPAGLARHLHISRARVTQILNILKLPPEELDKIALFGEKLKCPINERQLRSLLSMNEVKQKSELERMIRELRRS